MSARHKVVERLRQMLSFEVNVICLAERGYQVMDMVNGTTFGINQSLFVSKNTHYQAKEITHFP